jgi:probable addiction module antidote protein
MPKRTRAYDSWLLEKLTDPRIAANYINAASQDSDEMLLVALRNVAEAHKMTKVAEIAAVNRESLYKALSSGGNPQLKTVRSVLDAVGLRIVVEPKVRRNRKTIHR